MFDHILTTHSFESILLEKAQGCWVWDTKGNKYLDCTSGTWCVNLGHNHPKIVQTLGKQITKQLHRGMRFLTPETLNAAKQLLDFLPTNFDKVTFLNSGSEAVEFAINFAKKATKRSKILSLKDSYLGAYGLAKEASYTSSKASKLRIDYPKCDSINCSCLETYDELINIIIDEYSSEIACFVLESIMVSGGIHKPCTQFIEKLSDELQKKGVLLICNEVTVGMGRAGFRVGYEQFDIKPDIIALGKAIGNGYPVSVIATKSELEKKISFAELYYAQSHQLDPLGAAVISTVIEIFEREKIIEKSKGKIKKFNQFFEMLSYPFLKEFRSYGMIFGLEFQPINGINIDDFLTEIKDKLLEKGIMIGISLGKKILRLLPPLTITAEEIDFCTQTIKSVIDEFAKNVL